MDVYFVFPLVVYLVLPPCGDSTLDYVYASRSGSCHMYVNLMLRMVVQWFPYCDGVVSAVAVSDLSPADLCRLPLFWCYGAILCAWRVFFCNGLPSDIFTLQWSMYNVCVESFMSRGCIGDSCKTRCCGADFDECIQRCIWLVISSPDPLKKCDARVRIISWCHVLLFLWCCCVFGSYFCDRYFLGIRCKWYIWSIVR